MRIKAGESLPFAPSDRRRIVVFLNGQDVSSWCNEADDEAGYAMLAKVVHRRDRWGKLVINPATNRPFVDYVRDENGGIIYERHLGVVQIFAQLPGFDLQGNRNPLLEN